MRTTDPEGGSIFVVGQFTSQTHAFLVVVAYIVITVTAAFWLFRSKDIAGARGE